MGLLRRLDRALPRTHAFSGVRLWIDWLTYRAEVRRRLRSIQASRRPAPFVLGDYVRRSAVESAAAAQQQAYEHSRGLMLAQYQNSQNAMLNGLYANNRYQSQFSNLLGIGL